jgi:hypothetical protein
MGFKLWLLLIYLLRYKSYNNSNGSISSMGFNLNSKYDSNNYSNNYLRNFISMIFYYFFKFIKLYMIIGMITCIFIEIFMILTIKFKCPSFINQSTPQSVYGTILVSSFLCGIFWPIIILYAIYIFTELFCEYLFKYINEVNGTNYTIANPEFSYVFTGPFTDHLGNIKNQLTWTNDYNEIHRNHEYGPAIVRTDGTIIYYTDGEIDRPTHLGPAYIGTNGLTKYYTNGKINRPSLEGPAIIEPSGTITYCKNGNVHRPLKEGAAVLNEELDIVEYWLNGVFIENPQEWEAAEIIQRNWKISRWNSKYREFLAQVLMIPKNHDSKLGKLFPNGGIGYKEIFKNLVNMDIVSK